MSLFEILLIVSNCLTIIAIIAGPVMAAQLTREWLAKKDAQEKEAAVRKERRDRRLRVFETLMATRGAGLSLDHVRALNMIDLTFDGKESTDKCVLNAWKGYFDILHKFPHQDGSMNDGEWKMCVDIWRKQRDDSLAELLCRMANALGYDFFDNVHIKNNSYNPVAYDEMDDQWRLIRTGLIGLLHGHTSLPVCKGKPLPPDKSQGNGDENHPKS